MKMKLTLLLSILSAARVGAQTPIFRGECRVTVVEYLCTEDVFGEQCNHTRLTCDDSEGVIHDVLGPSSEEIMEMVDAGIIQSTISVFNPNDEETVSFDGENVIIDMSNGFSLENLSITQGNYPTMSPKKGDNKMLLVLIDALDYDVDYTESQLSSDVFGTNDDHTDEVNVSSQFRACSVNALRIFPGVETSMTAPGTIRVDINMNLNNGSDSAILNAAIAAANAKLNISLPGSYQNVYFAKRGCYKDGQGPGCGYGAYAGINSWYSMYPGRYITYSAIQGHEHGHNLGLYHSGEGGLPYGDHSCKMGNPLYGDELGKMCFNPAKSWFLEWYPGSGELVFDKNTDSVMRKKLVGAGEWENPNQGQVVIKIENGDKDLFVGFNRAAGANSQNDEFDDEVTVIEAKNSNTISYQSYIKAHLKNGEEYTQNGVTVKVCDLVTNVVPGYANIVIYNPSKNNGDCESGPTGLPTPVPTVSPTKYIPITKSDQWRIITSKSKSGWALDLHELNFYSDASCSKDSKVNPNGEPFDSGNAGEGWLPENVFNKPGRRWGGRKSGGYFLIGMRFNEVITVKCIELLQGGDPHYGPEWTVEAQQAGSWAKVAEKKNILPSNEHVRIQWVVLGPTPRPTESLSSSPTLRPTESPFSSPTKPCTDDPNFVKSRGGRQRTCQYIKDGRDHRKKKWCNKRKGGKLIKEFCCKTCESF